MRKSKYQQIRNFYDRLSRLGISQDDADALRRIEMTLSRWSERECNGEIERDEETGKTYSVSMAYVNGTGDYRRWPCPDRETGATKRLEAIMVKYPDLWHYIQTDPRGCALYVGKRSDMTLSELPSRYSQGFAVCY